MGRIKEIVKAQRVIIEAPVQRKDPFQAWEIRRIKYESLLWKIVAKGDILLIDIGYLLGTEKYGKYAECKIIEVEPNIEEVQITPETRIVIKHIPI
jgi:hypothetical protein